MGFANTIMGPIMNPLLSLGPFWALFIASVGASLLITIIYKLVTDQKEMKRLREQIKEFQAQMKGSRDNPDRLLSIQKQAMGVNMEYMKHSFKPTLITFIPIILIFGWLQAHLVYDPIMVGDEFGVSLAFEDGLEGVVRVAPPQGLEVVGNAQKQVESTTTFRLKGVAKGDYFIDFEYEGTIYSKDIIITDKQEYADATKKVNDGRVKDITVQYTKLKPMGDFSIFGWNPGWLGTYIIFSIISSITLRKMLKLA